MIETAVCPIAFYVSLQEYVVTTPTLDFCDGERKAWRIEATYLKSVNGRIRIQTQVYLHLQLAAFTLSLLFWEKEVCSIKLEEEIGVYSWYTFGKKLIHVFVEVTADVKGHLLCARNRMKHFTWIVSQLPMR